MKKNILWILLVIIIILLLGFNVFILQKKYNDTKATTIKTLNTIDTTWKSYKRETFDEENNLVDYSNNDNYTVKITSENITICTIQPEQCDTVQYRKEKNNYILLTNNEKIKNAKIQIKDNISEESIYIVKEYEEDEGFTIFYFKKQ